MDSRPQTADRGGTQATDGKQTADREEQTTAGQAFQSGGRPSTNGERINESGQSTDDRGDDG